MLDGRGSATMETNNTESTTFAHVITHGKKTGKQYNLVWSRDDDVAVHTGRAEACGEANGARGIARRDSRPAVVLGTPRAP